jgi:hypothetical protein
MKKFLKIFAILALISCSEMGLDGGEGYEK